jgi:hypothetical protein
MKTKPSNRFRKPEVVNLCGIELNKLGSLLKREREYLLETKSRLTSSVQTLLDLADEIAANLNIPQAEAWQILNSNGINSAGEDVKVRILPYLLRLQDSLDSSKVEEDYKDEAVLMILRSRLKPSFLEEIRSELDEIFDIKITDEQISKFKEVEYSDYLTDKIREEVCREIVSKLTEEIFEALLDFVLNEQSQWKSIDPSESTEVEVVDNTDPLQ